MTAESAEPRCVPIADHALLVEFATEFHSAANDAVGALDLAISQADLRGVREVVPAAVNLLVDFDPVVTDHRAVESAVRELISTAPIDRPEPSEHVVHVCYDNEFAPDLAAVAAATGLSPDAVVGAHLAADYRVLMYGFAPGYAYLTGVDERIRVPRKQSPVRGVAAGSVMITGAQCLVTTIRMPTGWSVIGRSATRVLRPERSDPFLFDPGDRVTFERIDRAAFERQVDR